MSWGFAARLVVLHSLDLLRLESESARLTKALHELQRACLSWVLRLGEACSLKESSGF